jgi:DNA polymerase-3 subunit epsilon
MKYRDRIFAFDFETTGLKAGVHQVHQMGILEIIDGFVTREHDIRVKKLDGRQTEQKAMSMANLTDEDLLNSPDRITYKDLHSAVISILQDANGFAVDRYDKQDKIFLCGYNIGRFDISFLQDVFVVAGDLYFGSWFYGGYLDVMVLAVNACRFAKVQPADHKLGTMCRFFGVEFNESDAHDALYDVRKTYELLECLSKHTKFVL